MSDGMDEIIEDFVTEAEESLEKIDPLFVELETEGYDREILNDIFRSMHTIKGAAGFLGFQSIVDVAHNTETLLKKLREGDMEITSALISLVLKSTDTLKLLLKHIKNKDGLDEDISEIMEELDSALLSDDQGEDAAGTDEIPEPADEAPYETGPVPDIEPDIEPDSETAPESSDEEQAPEEPVDLDKTWPAADMEAAMEDSMAPDMGLDDEEARQKLIDELFGSSAAEDAYDTEEFPEESPDDAFVLATEIEDSDEGGGYHEDTVPDDMVPDEIEPDASSVSPEIQAAIDAARRTLAGTPGVEKPASGKGAATPSPGAQPAGQPAGQQAGRQAAAVSRGGLQTLRVDVERIDKVMNLTGEIVLVRNRLLNISSALDVKISGDEHVEGLQEAVSFLDLVTSDIQLAVMKMRMQPIKKVFGKFPRLVRDISQNLGKDVQLVISGEDTEVDRSVIERIGDPLVHTLRNAIDHGIESVDERRAMGKPPKGLVEVKAYQQGSHIVIEVVDDGNGLDMDRIRQKALAQGLVSEEDAMRMTDKEAINLIFLPGFSTVDVATELSGRGVGMDVVKTNISRLNGYVEVLTTRGEGTTVRISIPLTLAIIQALMVRTEGAQYAIPLGPIEETLKVAVKEIDYVSGNPVLSIRDKVYPLAELSDMLNLRPTLEEPKGHAHRYVLVIAVGDKHFAIGVDELIGQEEVVIKAIDGIDTDDTGVLGATITGEGKIVLILDPSGMSQIIKSLIAVQ